MLSRPPAQLIPKIRIFLSFILFLIAETLADVGAGQPPTITAVSKDVTVSLGQPIALDCQAVGTPPIQYRWELNGQPVTSDSLSRTYQIASAQKGDAGRYRCVTSNQIGSVISADVRVDVAYLGSFNLTTSETVYQVQARRGTFFLLAPPPIDFAPENSIRWRWYFYDSLIFSNLTHFVSSIDGTLAVLDAQISTEGEYKVEAVHQSLPDRRAVSRIFYVSIVDFLVSNQPTSDPAIVLPPKNTVHVVKRSDQQSDQNAATLFEVARNFANGLSKSDQLILECVAHSSDAQSVQTLWALNGTPLVPDTRHTIVEQYGRVLRLTGASALEHQGRYQCQARRGVASDTSDAVVRIVESPIVAQELPKITQAALGRPYEIPCTIEVPGERNEYFLNSGEAPKTLVKRRWFHNGVELNRNDVPQSQKHPVNRKTGSLLIQSVGVANTGIYQCLVSNDAGSALVTTWLTSADGQSPLDMEVRNVSIAAGEQKFLSCGAVADPSQIVWKLNGARIVPNGVTYRLEGSNLVLISASTQQRGWYTCESNDGIGMVFLKSFVDVAAGLRIVNGPKDTSVVIGSNVLFPCKVEASDGGFGASNVARTWHFENALLTQGSSRNFEFREDGGLFIRQVGPAQIGRYTCRVTGGGGVVETSGTLTIIEKPGMPLDVLSELLNDTLPARARVTWTPGFDGNSPILRYLVEMQSRTEHGLWSDWETAIEIQDGLDRKSAIIDNMRPSATYRFRVVAVNRYGTGIPSAPSNEIMLPQQPPAAAPRNVAASARSSESVMVQWQPPPADQWNGDIQGYFVRYRLANYAGIPWLVHNVTDPRARNTPIVNLITWREYEIQVSAYNERGAGVFSKSVLVTTKQGVPRASVRNLNVTVLNSTAVYVSFVPPPQQMIPGVNLGYKVEAWAGPVPDTNNPLPGTSREQSGILTSSSSTPPMSPFKRSLVLPYSLTLIEHTVNGLDKFTGYNVTALCYTEPGDGPRAEPISVRTLEDVPGPVRKMHFREVVHDSALLIWEPPLKPNGRLLNYTLKYWETSLGPAAVKIDPISSNVTTYRVRGLKALTDYKFEMNAATKVGTGPAIVVNMKSGVPPEPPGAPSALKIRQFDSRSAVLDFTPGYDGKTTIDAYFVQAQVGASSKWKNIFNTSSIETGTREITIKNLRPFTFYRLRLISENVVGRSPYSEPSEKFKTKPAVPEKCPDDADAQPDSSTSVIVTWTPLATIWWNGLGGGYVIQYRKVDSANPESLQHFVEVNIADVRESQWRIEKMDPFSLYEMQVLSSNDVGRSDPSDVLQARTYEDAPSVSPRSILATASGPDSIVATWQPFPLNHTGTNGIVATYVVRCTPVVGAGASTDSQAQLVPAPMRQVEVNGAGRGRAVVQDLQSNTAYDVTVAAATVVGTGPESQPVRVTTQMTVPGAPSQVKFAYVSRDEVRIQWRPPHQRNGPVQAYEVAHWLNATGPSTAIRTQRPSDLYLFSATGLAPSQWYAFSIRAKNPAGWGSENVQMVLTSNSKSVPGVPTSPEEAINMERGSTHLWISFSTNADRVAPVRMADIEFAREDEGHWVSWPLKISANSINFGADFTAMVHNLAPFAAYKFRARVENDFGQSDWSEPSAWIKTLGDSPISPPISITSQPYGASGMRINWNPPPRDSWNSHQIGYRLSYRVYGRDLEPFEGSNVGGVSAETLESDDHWLSDETPKRSDLVPKEALVEKLERFTHYIIRIQSFNDFGSSPNSAPQFVYVGHSVPKRRVDEASAQATGSTEITLRWRQWDSLEEPIAGYKIRYRPSSDISSGADWSEQVFKGTSSDANMVRYVLRDLQKFATYEIQVAAFNKAGEGPSVDLAATTLEDVPGPVGALRFHEILLDSVKVSWPAPLEQNGEISRYRVNYRTYDSVGPGGSDTMRRQEVTEFPETRVFRATGLETNATYLFTVEAETSAGFGPPQTGVVRIGPTRDAPAAPTKPLVSMRSTTALLKWTVQPADTADVNKIVNGFIVQRRRVGDVSAATGTTTDKESASVFSPGGDAAAGANDNDGQWSTFTIIDEPVTEYSVDLSSLKPLSIYEFRVFARNGYGIGYPSTISEKLETPASVQLPFYYDWRFLLAIVLLALLFFFIVIAILCYTGRSGANNKLTKYDKRAAASVDSLQLANEDMMAAYELRARRHETPNGANGARNKRRRTASAGKVKSAKKGSKKGNLDDGNYDDVCARRPTIGAGSPGKVNRVNGAASGNVPATQSRRGSNNVIYSAYGDIGASNDAAIRQSESVGANNLGTFGVFAGDFLDADTSTTNEEGLSRRSDSPNGVPLPKPPAGVGRPPSDDEGATCSIAAHYATDANDAALRETWRRAKRHARPEGGARTPDVNQHYSVNRSVTPTSFAPAAARAPQQSNTRLANLQSDFGPGVLGSAVAGANGNGFYAAGHANPAYHRPNSLASSNEDPQHNGGRYGNVPIGAHRPAPAPPQGGHTTFSSFV